MSMRILGCRLRVGNFFICIFIEEEETITLKKQASFFLYLH
jgi:hypothetical protein